MAKSLKNTVSLRRGVEGRIGSYGKVFIYISTINTIGNTWEVGIEKSQALRDILRLFELLGGEYQEQGVKVGVSGNSLLQ